MTKGATLTKHQAKTLVGEMRWRQLHELAGAQSKTIARYWYNDEMEVIFVADEPESWITRTTFNSFYATPEQRDILERIGYPPSLRVERAFIYMDKFKTTG